MARSSKVFWDHVCLVLESQDFGTHIHVFIKMSCWNQIWRSNQIKDNDINIITISKNSLLMPALSELWTFHSLCLYKQFVYSGLYNAYMIHDKVLSLYLYIFLRFWIVAPHADWPSGMLFYYRSVIVIQCYRAQSVMLTLNGASDKYFW